MIQMSINLNRQALQSEDVKKLIKHQKLDIIINFPAFANEVASFLAYHTNSTLVLMSAFSFSMPNINHAIGDSYNPSYMPNQMLGYTQKMDFFQRCINTLATFIFMAVRYLYVLPQAEKILSEVFPTETIPSLDELGKKAGYTF